MEKTAGKTSLIPIHEMAFMGFFQVVFRIFTIVKWFKKVKEQIIMFQPDVIVLVDYPGFNLRIAKWAFQNGFKVAWYISPKVWAWNTARVHKIGKYVDQLFCILPFEKDFYASYGYDVSYFGNPLMDEVIAFQPTEGFREIHHLDKPYIAVLPGSRMQEIKRILPSMAEVARKFPTYQFVIPRSPNIQRDWIVEHIPSDLHSRFLILDNAYEDILYFAKAALVTSGTATLETALFNVPQIVCYKTGMLTYFLAKKLISIKFISLVNLIADKELVKECIQYECNPEVIAGELQKILSMDQIQCNEFYDILWKKMGEPGSADRVANAIAEMAKGD